MSRFFAHQYVGKFPQGAIQHIDDLMNAIAEGFTIFCVSQSGALNSYDFPIDAKLTENYIEVSIPSYDKSKMISSRFFPRDRGISLVERGIPPHTCHRSFIDRSLAEAYSNWMKTDPVYIANVQAFHESFNWRF